MMLGERHEICAQTTLKTSPRPSAPALWVWSLKLKLRLLLARSVAGMTPEATRQAFDWGPDRGREIVE